MHGLLLAVLLWTGQGVQTIPSNITKVLRSGAVDAACQWSDSLSVLSVGVGYDVVLLIDEKRWDWAVTPSLTPAARNSYQEIGFWIYPQVGAARLALTTASDAGPVCPIGTVNAGQRAHMVPLPPFTAPGVYVLEGTWIDRSTPTGMLPRELASFIGYTPTFSVTVKAP